MSNPVLAITDGTTRIDLLNFFKLVDWMPKTAAPKGGGVWRGSPFSQGRQLVIHEYDNIIDTFSLIATGNGSVDALIRATQDIRRLLEKAVEYWTTDWQAEYVWIETRGICETNTRYGVICHYRTPGDNNPFSSSSPMVTSATFDGFDVILEHLLWQEDEPGSTTDVEIGASEEYDGRNLGNVDDSGTDDPTTSDEVYIANKRNTANLSDIYNYDQSLGAFSANLLDAALPTTLFPVVAAANDVVYFGIDTTLTDSGPFCSLVFDLSTGSSGLSIGWEYWNGAAWAGLTVQDNTDQGGAMTGQPLDTTGVNSVHWIQPAAWATTAVNGVTGYWVRARIVAAPGPVVNPVQQNRDIYSVVWPYTEIDSMQMNGDLPSLIDLILKNYSDGGSAGVDLDVSDVIVGARTVARGNTFTAYINLSDEQNPTGFTITASAPGAGALVNWIDSPTGRVLRYNRNAISTDQPATIEITTNPEHYLGKFHVYVRVYNDISGGGAGDDFGVGLLFTIGGNFGIKELDYVRTSQHSTVEILDLGILDLPETLSDPGFGNLYIYVKGAKYDNTNSILYIYDLILMPTDEWAGEFFYYTGVTNIGQYTIGDLDYLSVISTSNYKRFVDARLIKESTNKIDNPFNAVSTTKPNVNTNTVRLWFLQASRSTAARYKDSGYSVCGRILLDKNAYYLGMRGDR